ncbi:MULTISPECIES: DUF4349 domain-containing protein [unclassified Rathayibacter]|uniref:DUF4349 domain-containing protein n=1 Tax=unclassified Rathayibacter TaxID=2609250 RepID=UPI0006FA6C1A|nr:MULTISPECIES: DUF4349 domain-containing protein [unclassified Rathayibacter]KQQ01577.1 hypothetical protein ASF42_14120 [Rathayibacter sp. Leaf294]KQS11609.1 hypothetical protein ASG06_14120 [Rathayibacter sp. Leaf185]
MTDPLTLAPLDDGRVSALEARVFRSIATSRAARSARRRRAATLGGVAAGLLVLAVVIGPTLGSASIGSSSSAGSSAADEAPAFAGSGNESNPQAAPEAAAGDSSTRGIVSTASATLEVPSVPDALEALTASAATLGGYVESSTTSALQATTDTMAVDPSFPAPVPDGSGVITLRVPADRLAEARDSLESLGTVTASSISRTDVTTQAIDLRAQVDSAQASVDRLTELIAQAGSLTDLLAAESALADRQASLESSQQQLTVLESQVSLASLTVTAVPESSPTSAEPAGFLDGLLAGWNGLIAAANGALIGIGFLLPWLVVIGVVALIVVAVRRRRGPPAPGGSAGSESSGA